MKTVKDVLLAYGCAMRERMRVPAWVVLSLAQPLLYLFLFGPLLYLFLFGPLLKRLTFGNDLYEAFVPGLLVLMAYFVAGGAGFGMLEDISNGVIERLRVTPLSRAALVLGPAFRDATTIGAQSLALLGIGQLTGLRLRWGSAMIAIGMVCALAAALSCLSNTLAHTCVAPTRSPRCSTGCRSPCCCSPECCCRCRRAGLADRALVRQPATLRRRRGQSPRARPLRDRRPRSRPRRLRRVRAGRRRLLDPALPAQRGLTYRGHPATRRPSAR